MSRQTKLKQNDNPNGTLSSNQNKVQQISSIRPYQKLSQNQPSRIQNDVAQFESPPAFYEYSHKSQGITPFPSNGQPDKKFVQLNLKNEVLQDLSNQQQKQPPKYSPRTAPSSPVKPILINKAQPKRLALQFNVLTNKLEEKEIHNEQDLSDVHFSIASNQDQDQCFSSRMQPDQEYKKSLNDSKNLVNNSLLILQEELRHPKVKPIRIPETVIKMNEQTLYSNDKTVELKDKPFQITCDSQRGTKRTLGEQYDTQFDDAMQSERYSDENRQIKRAGNQNRFQDPPHSQQSRRESNVGQNRKNSLNDTSSTIRNNTSQLVQDYGKDDIQYKLNYSSKYIPGQRIQANNQNQQNKLQNQQENEAKKKLEQNTPKFSRNTTCDSGQGVKSHPYNRQVILPQTREFNQQNNFEEYLNQNTNFNQQQNYRSPESQLSHPKQLTNEDVYTFQRQNKDSVMTENFKTISDRLTPRDNILSHHAQLTLEDLDEMRQFQIDAYNKFLSNTNQNSGSQKNIIDYTRKQDISTNNIHMNNQDNKSQYYNTQSNLTNISHLSDRYVMEQKLQSPNSQPIFSEVLQKNQLNSKRYTTDNDNSIISKLTSKQEYVNCSPVKANQSNLQFIHQRLARQKEDVLNNAYHNFSNNGNLKSKSARISPVRENSQNSISLAYNDNTQQKLNSLNQQSNNIEQITVFSPYAQNINFIPSSNYEKPQTINKEKKWEDLVSSIGGDSQNVPKKNIQYENFQKQQIYQSPQSTSKRDILEKLLKKSPTSSIPQYNDGVQELIYPIQEQEDEATKKSRNRQNSNQVIVNEISPNCRIQQILHNINQDTATPKSNAPINNILSSPKQSTLSPKQYISSSKQNMPQSKTQIPSPKQYNISPKIQINNLNNNDFNCIDDTTVLSYRSPKNVEQKMQTQHAATALMLNDKVTKRQPSPMNKDSQYSYLFSPNKQQDQIYLNQTQTPTVMSPKSNLKQVYQQLDDTKIQSKIAMIKSQLQTLNKQNTSVLQQHESNISQPSINSFNLLPSNPQSRYLSRDNSQSTLPPSMTYINQYVKRDEPQLQQYASNNKLPSDILAQDLQIQNSYPNQFYNQNQANSTTTTVTTVHTFKKPSPKKSSIGTNYSPFYSKYSNLEYSPNPINLPNSNNLANLNIPPTSSNPSNNFNLLNPPYSENQYNNNQTTNYNQYNNQYQTVTSILPISSNTQNPYNTHFSYNIPQTQQPSYNVDDLQKYQSPSNGLNLSPKLYQQEYYNNLSTNNIDVN